MHFGVIKMMEIKQQAYRKKNIYVKYTYIFRAFTTLQHGNVGIKNNNRHTSYPIAVEHKIWVR